MADLYFNNSSTGNTDWSDNSNWWDQPGAGGSNGYIPTTDDYLYFETSCDTNIPQQLDYYITVQNSSTLTLNTSNLSQNGGYTIQVNVGSTLNINESAELSGINNIDGIINISASFTGQGFSLGSVAVCNVYDSALLYGGTFSSGATINVTGSGALFLYNYTIIGTTINVTNTSLTYLNTSIGAAPIIAGTSNISVINGSNVSTNLTIPSNTTLLVASSNVATSYTITNNGTASLQKFSGNGAIVNNNKCSTSSSVSVSA